LQIEKLDSRFHGKDKKRGIFSGMTKKRHFFENDNKHCYSYGSRKLYYRRENWIPVFTGMTKKEFSRERQRGSVYTVMT